MKVIVGEILPLALVVTVSPLNIIPAILLLFTPRPLVNASAFLVGFTVGVGGVLAVAVAIAGAADLSPGTGHARWAGVVKLLLGAYLLMAAVRKFRGRPRDGQVGALPGWMDGIVGYGTGQALAAGAVLGAVNPKNVVVGVAAAVAIAAGGLSVGQQVAAGAVYTVIAVLGVAAPIGAMLLLGKRAPDVLTGWNDWLRQNNAAVLSVLFLVFGVVLVGQGIAAV